MGKDSKEVVVSKKDVDRILEIAAAVVKTSMDKDKQGYMNSLLSLFYAHVNPVHFRKLPAEVQKGLLQVKDAVNKSFDKSQKEVLDKVLEEKRLADKKAGRLN